MKYRATFNTENHYPIRNNGDENENEGVYDSAEDDPGPGAMVVSLKKNGGVSNRFDLKPVAAAGAQGSQGGLEAKAVSGGNSVIVNASVGKANYSFIPAGIGKRKIGIRDSVSDIVFVSGKQTGESGTRADYKAKKIKLKKKPEKKKDNSKIAA